MRSKNVTYREDKTIVDRITGEIKETERTKVVRLHTEPPFIKLYLDNINKLYDLPIKSSSALYELLKQMNYEGVINLNSSVKKTICIKTGYTIPSLDNYLSKLCKAEVIKRIDRGVFMPNPELFGKGAWSDIEKHRETWLKITLTKNGRKITSSLGEKI